jgi:hypothetical protein
MLIVATIGKHAARMTSWRTTAPGSVDIVVVNPRDMTRRAGKKTDKIDAD